jgi:glutathione S-transferase
VTAKLYWFGQSHPAWAARKMLELKGIDFDSVKVLPGTQRIHLRLARFRGGTVPALKLNGRRIQGSRQIARVLDQLAPEPRLFPADSEARAAVEEAEEWGEREFQSVPRIVLRWGLVRSVELRRWLAESSGMPAAGAAARLSGPTARYYAWVVGADEAAARRAVRELRGMLDRVDALLAQGTLDVEKPNAASLQILSTIRSLDGFADFHEQLAERPSREAARRLFPEFAAEIQPFIPAGWH